MKSGRLNTQRNSLSASRQFIHSHSSSHSPSKKTNFVSYVRLREKKRQLQSSRGNQSQMNSQRNSDYQFHTQRLKTVKTKSKGQPKSINQKIALEQLRKNDSKFQSLQISIKQKQLELIKHKNCYRNDMKTLTVLSQKYQQTQSRANQYRNKVKFYPEVDYSTLSDDKHLALLSKTLTQKNEAILAKLNSLILKNRNQREQLQSQVIVKKGLIERLFLQTQQLLGQLDNQTAALEGLQKQQRVQKDKLKERQSTLSSSPQFKIIALQKQVDFLKEKLIFLCQRSDALKQNLLDLKDVKPNLKPHLQYLRAVQSIASRAFLQQILKSQVEEDNLQEQRQLQRLERELEGRESILRTKQSQLQNIFVQMNDQTMIQQQLNQQLKRMRK